MLLLAQLGYDSSTALISPMVIIGMMLAGIAGAMHAVKETAATAGSLAGALQMIDSGIVTSVVVPVYLDSLALMAVVLTFSATAGVCFASPSQENEAYFSL